ncbi:hypothetical protein FOFC_08167 [Fusarium oxysporum]|nr:hypothetical protein FOFC_08167 [Fusarium oxysporum]
MDHKIFQYGLIKGTRGFSSLNNDSVAYLTRNGTTGSVRNDDGRFLAVLQSQLHLSTSRNSISSTFQREVALNYIQFSSWRRFVELSWEGDSCRATAELPKGLKNVNVQLRKGTTVITLGITSPEPLTYALDDRDIYTILFDPAMYEGFVVVFSADGEHQNDMRAISKPLAYRVRKLKWTVLTSYAMTLNERIMPSTEKHQQNCVYRATVTIDRAGTIPMHMANRWRYYKDVCASFTTVQYRRDGTTRRGVLARESDIAI